MIQKVRKRTGAIVDFNPERITNAIWSATHAVEIDGLEKAQGLSQKVIERLKEEYLDGNIPAVEEIQDMVERILVENNEFEIAKAFILYRQQHAQQREIVTTSDINMVNLYLGNKNWKIKENSNMTFSLQGLNNHISSGITKTYWLNEIYPKEIRKAHLSGDFHIHDLSIFGVYCVGWDLFDILTKGFKGAKGKVESKAPKHFKSALGQIINFFFTLQGEAAGALAFSNFDTLLAPFIHYDKLDYVEVKQALQAFIFNMNVPTRVGFQTPFTNITLDLKVPSYYVDQPVVIGGVPKDKTYGDFQKELDTFNRAFLEVMGEGDASGRVFTFPIPTYNITKGFDWEDKNILGLWKIAAKYGIPYFSNFINSDMDPEDARSMCCRLRIDNRELERRGGGGLFGSNPLTGSIGVVTINLPRLGYLSRDEEDFKKRLDELMYLGKESLETKRKILERFTEADLYPYSKYYLRKMKERYGVYWKNHFSTIGLLGMNEAAVNLMGVGIGTEKGMLFANRILDYMRERLLEFTRETGNNYNLEATPAEGTSYRLAKMDKKTFPRIKCANEDEYIAGAEPFYTNSSHLPVNFTDDMFEVLDRQDELQTKYTGGTVLHLFFGQQIQDLDSVKNMVKIICNRYHLPYFTFTPTFSICSSHGYISGKKPECPDCGSPTEIYSRIVGYLRPINQWNNGKREEFKLRETFEFS